VDRWNANCLLADGSLTQDDHASGDLTVRVGASCVGAAPEPILQRQLDGSW
jgi:hypothetical protein